MRGTHCSAGMTPTHTRRRGRLYRYYVCLGASRRGHDTCPVRSIAAGEVEGLVLGAYRFGAGRAYADIVAERLGALEEERVDGLQPFGQFLRRRFEPAMRTCRSVEARQESLSRRIARAADLLRTRVDVQLEAQNQALLASLDRRAQLQLRLQETVEGLSVVAISYYLVGLVGYLVRGLDDLGLPVPVPTTTALALTTPVAVALVWLAIRRLRRRLAHAP
jgi:uncharacterized membrane-anchored protein